MTPHLAVVVFSTGCSDVLVLSWSAGRKAELGAQLHAAQGALHHPQGNRHSPQRDDESW